MKIAGNSIFQLSNYGGFLMHNNLDNRIDRFTDELYHQYIKDPDEPDEETKEQKIIDQYEEEKLDRL